MTDQNDPSFPTLWDELEWRGLVHVSTDADALRAALQSGPLAFYCGFDPTASSLHLGHLVQLLTMRRLQLAGHRPVALVGGATGLIGDPRPTAERTMQEKATVAEWVDRLQVQISRFLSFGGANPAQMVNNLDWTVSLSAVDFLRDLGKHYRVGAMIKKDAVAARLESAAGISYTEFSYQILQGHDFLELYRRMGCTLQTGGSDQWGNLVSGIDLIRKTEGAVVHALGTPLITNSDGTKFGKSEGNAIWLDPERFSPYAFYQFWLNSADADVIDRLRVFTFLTRAQIEEYADIVAREPRGRAAQRRLADEVTRMVHGDHAADAVRKASEVLFGDRAVMELDEEAVGVLTAELPCVDVDESTTIADALRRGGLVSSNAEARRAVAQGGVSLDGARATNAEEVISFSGVSRASILRRGKKAAAVLIPRASSQL